MNQNKLNFPILVSDQHSVKILSPYCRGGRELRDPYKNTPTSQSKQLTNLQHKYSNHTEIDTYFAGFLTVRQWEFGMWHPGWGRENREHFFTVYKHIEKNCRSLRLSEVLTFTWTNFCDIKSILEKNHLLAQKLLGSAGQKYFYPGSPRHIETHRKTAGRCNLCWGVCNVKKYRCQFRVRKLYNIVEYSGTEWWKIPCLERRSTWAMRE